MERQQHSQQDRRLQLVERAQDLPAGRWTPGDDPTASCLRAAVEAHRWAAVPPSDAPWQAESSDKLVLHAMQDENPEEEWAAQRWRLRDALVLGDPDRMNSALGRMVELATEIDQPSLRADTLVRAAMIATVEGRFSDVEALHRRAWSCTPDVPTATLAWQGMRCGWDTGAVNPERLDVVSEASPASIRLVLHPWVALVRPGFDRWTRRQRDVFVEDIEPDELPEDAGVHAALCMAAHVAATAGEQTLATELYERLRPYSDLCAVDRAMPQVWFGSTHLYLGMLAVVLGKGSQATEHLKRADYVHTRMGARCLLVRGKVWRAHAARLSGAHRTANELVRSARRSAEALGLLPVVARCGADSERWRERGWRADKVGARWHLRKDGATWLITTSETSARIPNRKGLAYLHRLISSPGQEMHVLDLVGGGAPRDGGSGAVLDPVAKEAYRRRMEDLRDQIDEGERWCDPERVSRARAELQSLAREVAAAVGLAGRDRPSDAGERARVSVRKAITSAIDVICDRVPDVAAHLQVSVRTGYYCVYEPDPAAVVTWA